MFIPIDAEKIQHPFPILKKKKFSNIWTERELLLPIKGHPQKTYEKTILIGEQLNTFPLSQEQDKEI